MHLTIVLLHSRLLFFFQLAISMEQQLDLFKEYKEKVIATAGPERAATVISDSLYVICAGRNDVLNTYFPTL